ncbi:hypothetical protein AX774_g6766, partial [Zancudomyces culisetae]
MAVNILKEASNGL